MYAFTAILRGAYGMKPREMLGFFFCYMKTKIKLLQTAVISAAFK